MVINQNKLGKVFPIPSFYFAEILKEFEGLELSAHKLKYISAEVFRVFEQVG